MLGTPPSQNPYFSTNIHHISNTLIAGLKRGDQDAFRQLVALYQDKVYNTALGMVHDHGMAEDIAQETFVTIFKSVLSFNGQSSVATWIYRITVNKCLDHLRAKNRAKRAFIFSLFSAGALPEPVHTEHPGLQLEQRENVRYLFAAIDTLPDNQRIAFVLAHIEDLPQKEIAEIMDISVKAVESLLQRAKGNLRKKLGDIYDRRKT